MDTPIFGILSQYSPYNGKMGDSRLAGITVRQVLHHVGGWDRMISGDPSAGDPTIDISNATRSAFPPSRDDAIRYMLAQRLDFEPGSRFAYSNFGYMLLGRVIEKISGDSYAEYVRSMLTPLGLRGFNRAVRRLPAACRVRSSTTTIREHRWSIPMSLLLESCNRLRMVSRISISTTPAEPLGRLRVDLAKFTTMLDGTRPARAAHRRQFRRDDCPDAS